MTWVDYLAFDCVLYCKPHCALYCAFYCISYCEHLRLTGRASQGLVVVVIRPCYTCQRTGCNTAFASPFLMLFFPSLRNTVTSRQHHHPITLRHYGNTTCTKPNLRHRHSTPQHHLHHHAAAYPNTRVTTLLQHPKHPIPHHKTARYNTPYSPL